ncbi:SNF2 domain-containing protein CLASSY 2-like [Mercurialis annua]|uniref:SNF2 domain-containing protein CLASSY 2-like n=1 Tax=Mercurialis annua TaxID=3986 RepID=UPI002160D26C|nr:SNF2 domain-containing protein CLASSY 2-like [Mercurialis annua]XP_050209975.1 SNF2 domain-containing protein CLASSY 2-like [Mercurialis annua]XP_050209976.1 SNF2 domain-containing protein CLASSY 2-like [Mercurialis annua]XP_050209977.1 SNF2 domain-containing protein CLASSY 2-like [Mercurialis annua]XP_050209978.1 SNF2 domain-containing protein CLASSY 2-like [Mercurialis annua]XP_050209979.1 SNF2 domain-containing protein CLASSY 2-like [Mercurialis annua]
MKRKRLDESDHPFDAYAFEALCCGSWQNVEFLEIRDGGLTFHFADSRYAIDRKDPYSDFRLRSRKATISDCTCFLRRGIDICVLSSTEDEEHLENSEVWTDARINSIERKPHEPNCECKIFIKRHINQGPLGSERVKLSKDIEEVGIDRIRLLQRLDKPPCEGEFYRWQFSQDCSNVQRTKLFIGKFCSDITWLLVASVFAQFAFDVRSVQNKIVYQILGNDENCSSLKSNNQLKALSFRVENDILTPLVLHFSPDEVSKLEPVSDIHGEDSDELYSVTNLRRSKRRNVQPDRFLGCDLPADVGWVRCMPYTPDKWKEEEMFLPLSLLFGQNADSSPEQTEEEIEEPDDIPLSKFKKKSSKVNRREPKNKLAIVPVPAESDPEPSEELNSPEKSSRGNLRKTIDDNSFDYYRTRSSPAARKISSYMLDGMVVETTKWRGRPPKTKFPNWSYRRSAPLKRNDFGEPLRYRKTTLSAGAYNKLIRSYMKNIDSTISSKEETQVIDQWEEFKAKSRSNQTEKTEPSPTEDEDEESETEMLWKEMELCLASTYLLDEHDEVRISTENMQNSDENCEHEFKLDEEIGILCHLCGFVSTEVKFVSAPFAENVGWAAERRSFTEEDSVKPTQDDGLNIFDKFVSVGEDVSLPEDNNTAWALIPDLRMKLHVHQKKAFEFLWKNVAGSIIPAEMENTSKKIGGCVVSHTPGAGKTFLIIAFLTSYLKLFPGKRPLVLAPKTTLYTWYKEFIKWKIPVPVHLIHGRKSYHNFRDKTVAFRGGPKPSQDVMHVLDCLEKIQKWHAQPSVLVMGYTSFLTLMREDSKFDHRIYLAKVLRESPGLLILDEGHNPRSTKSRLRKVLMKVQTDLRILLSGTVFQNNFCEYFNTLCLARPKFIREVLKALDPKFKRKKKGEEKARHLLESRARKFFLDNIARKIDNTDDPDERMEGINMLRKITSGFIDVYEGGPADGLPGLQIYTILMNSTDIQHEILVKLHKIMATYHGYPLELELLITLAAIHPWLIKTSNCVNKFFSGDELDQIEKLKYDFKKGSKVMFVLNLVYRIVKKEKVLIFCHNIAPINTFVGLFENVFRWQKGREIMVLTGDLELFERGKIIDKFEEPGSPSRVLLASITACAEGISLTAASRVILLDSEWNPSKTKQAIARAFRPGQQKVVYVYQLLATGTLEEDKYSRTTWKEWVSSMIFSEAFVEDPSRWQAEKIEDDVLREMVEEDRVKSFHMIMKNEKASTG